MARLYTLPDARELYEGTQFVLNEVTYPSNWLQYATNEDLADRAIMVQEIAPPPAPEEPAPVYTVSKSTVVDRLYQAGKLPAARAALNAADLYTQERWNTRSYINCDDPTAIGMMQAIGADPAVMLAPE